MAAMVVPGVLTLPLHRIPSGIQPSSKVLEMDRAGVFYIAVENVAANLQGLGGSDTTGLAAKAAALDVGPVHHALLQMGIKLLTTDNGTKLEGGLITKVSGSGQSDYVLNAWAEVENHGDTCKLMAPGASTQVMVGERKCWLRRVKLNGIRPVKAAGVGGLVTCNRALVPDSAQAVQDGFISTLIAAIRHVMLGQECDGYTRTKLNQLVAKDSNGFYRHVEVQPERVSATSPDVQAAMRKLTDNRFGFEETKAMFDGAYTYSIYMSSEMTKLFEVDSALGMIRDNKYFIFGTDIGPLSVINLARDDDRAKCVAKNGTLLLTGTESSGRTHISALADAEQRAEEAMEDVGGAEKPDHAAGRPPALYPCKTYYFYDATVPEVRRLEVLKTALFVGRLAVNAHAEGKVADPITQYAYGQSQTALDGSERYIAHVEDGVDKATLVGVIANSIDVMGKQGKGKARVSASAGNIVFLSVEPAAGSGVMSAICALREAFHVSVEERFKDDEAARELYHDAFSFKIDKQAHITEEGLVSRRTRKLMAMKTGKGIVPVQVLTQVFTKMIEPEQCSLGFDLGGDDGGKREPGKDSRWVQEALRDEVAGLLESCTNMPQQQRQQLLTESGAASWSIVAGGAGQAPRPASAAAPGTHGAEQGAIVAKQAADAVAANEAVWKGRLAEVQDTANKQLAEQRQCIAELHRQMTHMQTAYHAMMRRVEAMGLAADYPPPGGGEHQVASAGLRSGEAGGGGASGAAFTPVTVVDGTVGDGDGGSRGDETADGWQTAGYGRGSSSRRGRRSAPAAGAVESAGSVRSPLRAKRGADNAAGGTNVSQLTKLGGKPGARGASGSSPSR